MIPDPPFPFPRVNCQSLAAGTIVHRVHDANWPGGSFNPCQGRPTRFSPIRTAIGTCIPTLYAASTFECAVYETVFHEVPVTARRKTVKRQDIDSRAYSEVRLSRDLTIVTLNAPDLLLWGLRRGSLVDTSPAHYGKTALWAAAIHQAYPDVEGLNWTSRKCDPASAFLLFGDRIAEGDLHATLVHGAGASKLRADIQEFGRRAGIVIST